MKTSGSIDDNDVKIVLRGMSCDKKLLEKCIAQCEKAAENAGKKLEFFVSERYDDTRIEIDYPADAPKLLMDEVTRIFVGAFPEELYSMDDTPLEKRLYELLKVRGKKISVAESFTGGGIGSRIVSVPGASEVYFEGLNTYSGNAKIKRLGVSPFTLNTVGAVSDQTAYEMCAGLLSSGDCDAAIATTGLAGPKSDESGSFRHRIDFTCRDHRKDGKSALRFASGTGRKNIYRTSYFHGRSHRNHSKGNQSRAFLGIQAFEITIKLRSPVKKRARK
mgnify:CR=1 FL=1